ncbi:hypothetical protein BABINDRAFT_160499 [Babjeviella inositovora NRRL Y-12698]|uniref:Uncharacterized protein n=1 Tax=Babjeviella inositovora NRRL Y-12698 TaxID=984486 RepID=A0A1E3QTU7_9ASCO|nr:uncharacterized protein BABINDRAFT_160499 [Babjeviella inositovora NRRL Y-12698]ODQ81089.1 hypothetical protein BABINDRAFT_160499 [Babjeviella inositovora NRRL Y-12698]
MGFFSHKDTSSKKIKNALKTQKSISNDDLTLLDDGPAISPTRPQHSLGNNTQQFSKNSASNHQLHHYSHTRNDALENERERNKILESQLLLLSEKIALAYDKVARTEEENFSLKTSNEQLLFLLNDAMKMQITSQQGMASDETAVRHKRYSSLYSSGSSRLSLNSGTPSTVSSAPPHSQQKLCEAQQVIEKQAASIATQESQIRDLLNEKEQLINDLQLVTHQQKLEKMEHQTVTDQLNEQLQQYAAREQQLVKKVGSFRNSLSFCFLGNKASGPAEAIIEEGAEAESTLDFSHVQQETIKQIIGDMNNLDIDFPETPFLGGYNSAYSSCDEFEAEYCNGQKQRESAQRFNTLNVMDLIPSSNYQTGTETKSGSNARQSYYFRSESPDETFKSTEGLNIQKKMKASDRIELELQNLKKFYYDA